MTAIKVTIRALMGGLIWPLLLTPALAQDSAARADADAGARFHLTGVLVSGSGRSALVNSSVYREGDRVAGAEILAIREGEVQLLVGSRELTMRVGGVVATDRLSGFDGSRQSPGLNITAERAATAATTQSPAPAVPQTEAGSLYGPVMPGETLSEIAERHLVGDVSIDQMMIALFDANPQAFGGNINVLREGAVLRIPDDVAVQQQLADASTTEVIRQMDAWKNGQQQPTVAAEQLRPQTYGPVRYGETLSEIAARVSRGGATTNQTMIALFDANPQAFGGNINILHEGAMLRVPDDDVLHQRAPTIATADVARHMEAWRLDHRQPVRSASADEYVNAPRQPLLPPSDGVLLSMTSSE